MAASAPPVARLVVEADGIDVVTREGGDVDALHERWISHLEARGRERSTIYGYRKKYGQVSDLIGKLPVAMVTTERIDAAYDELVRRGSRDWDCRSHPSDTASDVHPGSQVEDDRPQPCD